MKKRHIIVINMIFVGLMLFSAHTVYEFITGSSPIAAFLDLFTKRSTVAYQSKNTCSQLPSNKKLHAASLPQLQVLHTYQQACRSFATDTMMVFVSMPQTVDEAITYAKKDAKILKEFAQTGITPLVIAEPSDQQGTLLNFELFANGGYNSQTAAYFMELKQQGLDDAALGIWNPFPEANLPYWNNNKPEYFGPAATNYLTIARQYFPQLSTSILLNSATYEVTDFSWENGDYNSLLPYVRSITPGLIDYAGIQGFPWVSRQGGNGIIFNAAEFLQPDLLTEMAEALGTKKVWFNTGTFSLKYIDPEAIRHIEPARRKEILLTVIAQAEMIKQQGFDVAVNLFSQDKRNDNEETDWSYWRSGQPQQSEHTSIFIDFARDLYNKNIKLWLFDTK